MSDEAPLWNDWGTPEPAEHIVGQAHTPMPASEAEFNTSQESATKEAPEAANDTAQQGDVHYETDQAHIAEVSRELSATWGPDYQVKLDGVKSIVDRAPPQIREFILGARYVDGQAIANDPKVLNWLATFVPSASNGQSQNQSQGTNDLDAEIASIETKFGTKEYIRNESLQARLRELYAQRGH